MLKQLELIGFKSFADKTAFDFSTGITGVVGPNGSGKSNVVDSIKWILGDQSASSLRGKSMSDVIFNGSSTRSGSPFAEATLTFDNDSRFLPVEQSEVRVGRRLWRSGDSEYLINGEVARLKDVRNLFMGTGAGASSYCIIEQGRVAQILQTNAASRRLVFEEAAGISRYQSRRAEALRKLERVEQHIARLSDIVDEAESRLSSVRNQAARAARYREVRTEFQGLWVGLAADEYRRISTRREALAAEMQSLNASVDSITAEQEQLEAERSRTEAALTSVEEQLREHERIRNELQSRIASLRTTLRHEHARLTETESDLQRLRVQSALLRSRSQEAADELERTRGVIAHEQAAVEQLQANLAEAETRFSEFKSAITDSQQSLESDRAALMQQLRENSVVESRISATEQKQSDAAAEVLRLQTDVERTAALLAECEERFQREQQNVESLEAELAAADEGIVRLRAQREEIVQQAAEKQTQLAALREERTSGEARLSVLEDLERRQEGLRVGTREILRRAEEAQHEPWTSIVGSVNDLLDVDLDKAALLEVALADRAQLIVIREMDAFIEYINSGRCQLEGRVGFVSLQDIRNSQFLSSPWRPADAELPDLSGQQGVVCAAAELARCSEKTPRLATHLLGDTWIVETLNDAIYLSDKTQRKCRFVTLQGELVESDGTLFAGIELSATSVLTRRSELKRLRGDLQSLDRRIEDQRRECNDVEKELAQRDAELSEAMEHLQSRSETLAELRSAFAEVRSERNRVQQDLSGVESRIAELQEKDRLLQTELGDDRERLGEGEQLIADLEARLSQSEETLIGARRRLDELTAERNQAELALGKQEERFAGQHATLQRLETDLRQRGLQQEEAERRVAAADEREREIRFRILEATAELSELHQRGEEMLSVIREFAQEARRLKEDRSGVAGRESALAGQRRELATTLHAMEMESGTLQHQLENTESRIQDEFQFSLTDAVRSGVSAMAAHVIPPLTQSDSDVHHESADETEAEAETDSEDPAELAVDVVDDEGDTEQHSEDAEEPEPEADAENDGLSAVEQLDDEEFEQLRSELEERVERLRRRLRKMGNVSTESLENLEEIESRFGGLSEQLQDLIHARDTLEAIVRRINAESKRLFAETFESIRGHFQDLFRKLFGGGEGDVILEDPDDVLECGIDIVARPPGKELRSISLLSGGEKTMTAVALLLAIFRSRPSPFCILDEVDAALDEANVDRFVQVLREFQETTQFIMITHRKPSMAVCDLIFGVTMEESGVSKRLTVRFEDVDENGDFIVPDGRSDAA